MRKLTNEEFIEKAKEIHGDKYDYSKVDYKKSIEKVCIICPTHGEFWQRPNEHLNGHKCPFCSPKSVAKTTEQFISEAKAVHGDKYDYSKVEYKNNHDKVCIVCPKHGEFWQKPSNHLHGEGCYDCGKLNMANTQRMSKEEFIERATRIHGNKYDYSKIRYINANKKVEIICNECGNTFFQTPSSHINNGCGCPYCAKKRLFNSRVLTNKDFIEKAREIHGDKYDYSKVNYKRYEDKVTIICPVHGEFEQTPDSHLQGKGCYKCSVTQSKAEDEIFDFITNTCGVEAYRRDRKLIKPYEIDIYIPTKKIGIEYNGILWHSEKFKDNKNYHVNKTEAANKCGIRLIQIFEDEYINNKEIVLSKIAYLLGAKINNVKIMARKCIIEETDYHTSFNFLKENHIQGGVGATVYLSAKFNDEIVGIMQFKSCGKNEWDLNRFATKKNTICQGLGSKMFTYFVQNYHPDKVKSFADRRWTINNDDNLYTKLGFKFDCYILPEYRYYKPNTKIKRIHKFNFRKNVLSKKYNFPLTMTEKEMVQKLGYYRIYDCGLLKYVWKKEF